MKSLLLATWLMIAGVGYYGYDFYQKMVSDNQAAAQIQSKALSDANAVISGLKGQLAQLQDQLVTEKKAEVALKPAPGPISGLSSSTQVPSSTTPISIPSTITTLSGKTYTGCILSHVWPDGISFTHSEGVAKVLFSDLDPAFATFFGYDPVAARKFEAEQAQIEAKNDRDRILAAAKERATEIMESSISSGAKSHQDSLSPDERAAIQKQIVSLQNDIVFMQGEEAKLTPDNRLRLTGDQYSPGAYPQKIAEEQAQVQQLQAELK